jgi:hypothetical protein
LFRSRLLAVAAAMSLAACLVSPKLALCAGDPWYYDLGGHWARDYVRVLWEESVTDGYIPSVNPSVAKYWPDADSTRAQFATLLCKVFGLPPRYPENPSYPDVPRSYHLFWNKPGWHWIEGAFYGGIIFVPRGDYFRPDSYITREDAVELLIRSLDLESYAASLSLAEVSSILGRFYDSWSVSQNRRRSMACAISVGIIKGYEDGSLRPRSPICRAEAATVAARSCLIRMIARRDSFSPDGDGLDDVVDFDLTYLRNRGIASWQAVMQDSLGSIVCTLGPPGGTGPPPATVSWDGRDSRGNPAPASRYYYQAVVTDQQNRQFMSVRRPLDLERHVLSAWLQPSVCRDGSVLTLGAMTSPRATWVNVVLADGRTRSLVPVDASSLWQLGIVMGPFLPIGTQTALVNAWFGDTTREERLSFTRAEDLWLVPSITPNPATWGQRVQLGCRTSSSVVRAEAKVLGLDVTLSADGSGSWQAAVTVPWGLSPGFYPAVFTVWTSFSSAQGALSLEVTGPNTAGLTYVLSK